MIALAVGADGGQPAWTRHIVPPFAASRAAVGWPGQHDNGAASTILLTMTFTIANRPIATCRKSEFGAVVAVSTVPTTMRPVVMFVAQLSLSVQAPDAARGFSQKSDSKEFGCHAGSRT